MIPADIDNFIVDSINVKEGRYVVIRGLFRKIPKEIRNCSSLSYLNLYNKQIVDISALSNCSSLTYLDLDNNRIVDISALSNCSYLTTLYLNNNQIVDISALSNCSYLTCLSVGNNPIKRRIKFNSNVRVCY